MRNFLRIDPGLDVTPLLLAIKQKPHLWDQNALRTTHELTPHKQVSDIWLRFNDLTPYQNGDAAGVIDEHESINYPAMFELPQARPLIFWLMARMEGERLGRCLITKLPPGGRIAAHVDGGSHAAYYERVHIALQSNPQSLFRCGDEVINMQAGEVWWFQNAIEHEIWNDGDCDRIHLIVDLRTTR